MNSDVASPLAGPGSEFGEHRNEFEAHTERFQILSQRRDTPSSGTEVTLRPQLPGFPASPTRPCDNEETLTERLARAEIEPTSTAHDSTHVSTHRPAQASTSSALATSHSRARFADR